MAPWGVRVVITEPGIFRTGLASPQIYTAQCEQLWVDLTEDMKREYGPECRHQCKVLSECSVISRSGGFVCDMAMLLKTWFYILVSDLKIVFVANFGQSI